MRLLSRRPDLMVAVGIPNLVFGAILLVFGDRGAQAVSWLVVGLAFVVLGMIGIWVGRRKPSQEE